jgi:signal transduction histidine kinase/CheY-like chemotaxis protein
MAGARGSQSGSGFERELRDMNEALLVSSIHQQELTEQAQGAEAALRRSEAELRAYSEELARFNRAAVGRELRLIELKRELNELTRRHGEPPRYVLESEDKATAETGERSTPAAPGAALSDDVVPLESILRTDKLTRRPRRLPDYETESRLLASLVQSLAKPAVDILQVMAEKTLEALKADSAGVSLLTRDEKRLQWAATAGAWQAHVGRGTLRNFGLRADVFRGNKPLLLQHFERLRPVTPAVAESLLVPFYADGKAVGTLWALSHSERRFDAEDLRLLETLGRFASAAHQVVEYRELEHSRRAAALNLMEDAVQSRRAMEKINAELRASETKYRTLFTSIDEGFCVIEMLFDRDGGPVDYRFLETNPGFEKQTGLHGAAGKRIRELAPNHEGHWFQRFGQVALTGESVRFVNIARDLGGRWFDVYAFRLGEPDSRRVAVLFTDITARIRLEEAASQQARSLADMNRRKDEFLAMLSHELRNPLSAILNASRLLRLQQDRNPVQIEAQALIDRQAAQLDRLVEDLLEVSRISTGRIRVRREPVDLPGIVCNAIETVRPQVGKKGLPIAVALPDRPLWVDGDPVRLEQIVVNLLSNAIKYTDRGGHIRVELNAEAGEAVLRVRDNGVGIAPEMLPHIFDLFTQADRSLDRAQGGLGIGLALVRSLVAIHAGRVEVQSKLDEGSEFVVKLPMRSSPKLPVADTVEAVPARAGALKVLVVDDNLDAARSAVLLLQALGHDASSAHDGMSAVKAAVDYVPDIVLLDIGLPVVDGWQVAARIRQQPTLGHVMLVAVTGYGQESHRRRAQQAGFDHYLVKPMDLVQVKAILSAASAKLR